MKVSGLVVICVSEFRAWFGLEFNGRAHADWICDAQVIVGKEVFPSDGCRMEG